MNVEVLIAGIILGFIVGWMAGTWAEHRLWLDAICGRERIWNSRKKESQ